MTKPKLEIKEKYADDFELEKLLASIFLPDISANIENGPMFFESEKRGTGNGTKQ